MLTEKIDLADNYQMLTIVIPVYNCEKYLRSAVTSVLNQAYKNISVVLVDDGSTDGSSQLCDELASASNRVTVLHQENAGVSAARNTGIEFILSNASRNNYIAFLDADDEWVGGFFSADTGQLLQKGYDLIGFQSCNCDAQLHPYDLPGEMQPGLHSGGQTSVWLHADQTFAAMLYSCTLLQKYNIRFFDELRYSEDKIFSMQCMYLADTVYLENQLLYLYRHTGISTMNRRSYGIPYYVPIINGYIKLDSLMQCFSDTHGQLFESRLMASIYIMDMIDEHYNVLRSKAALDELLRSNHDYVSIVEATGKYSDMKPNSKYAQYREYPATYIIKKNLNGGRKICKKICNKLLRLKK